MSWLSGPAAGTGVSADGAPAAPGQTVIAARAIVAIARRAAAEVEGVELVSHSGLGHVLAGLLPGVTPTGGASAEVGRGTTALALHLAVGWPEPVARVTEAARRHVRDRVAELTGYAVTAVDIVVDSLPPPGSGRRRVV